MKTIIRFFYTNYPECTERVDMAIPKGSSIPDLVELCTLQPGMTIPPEILLKGKCIVEGRPVSEQFLFSGFESDVDFFDVVGSGC